MENWNDYCLEAVKQNGLALEYVKEQTKEICLEAVKQDGYALQYVKEQTPEIIHFIMKNKRHIYEELSKQYNLIRVTEEEMEKFYEENPHLLLTL